MVKRGLIFSVLAFLLFVPVVSAAPAAPEILESEWLTGEIKVCYTNVTPGNAIYLYTAKWDEPGYYTVHDVRFAESSTGCFISSYYENGQTIWFYIKQQDANGDFSDESNHYKLTPPITAYIINWPEIFVDLGNLFQQMNEDMQNYFDGLFTPSDTVMDDLTDAINDLKDTLGGGQVIQIGDNISGGFNGMQPGMSSPIGVDDGNGTYTGGNTGGQLPFSNQPGGGGLVAPNPDSGTDTELTMRIPIGIYPDGSLYYIKLFTQEQMEKMKWLNLVRQLAGAIIFILFGIWLVVRFAPQLKA